MFPKYKSKHLPSRPVDDQLHVSFGILKTTSVISLVAQRILNQTSVWNGDMSINCRNCLPPQLPTKESSRVVGGSGYGWNQHLTDEFWITFVGFVHFGCEKNVMDSFWGEQLFKFTNTFCWKSQPDEIRQDLISKGKCVVEFKGYRICDLPNIPQKMPCQWPYRGNWGIL